MNYNNLEQLRKEIDDINFQLLKLLNQRTEIVKSIGIEKQKQGLKIHDPKREQKIINGILEKNEGPLSDDVVKFIFNEIFKLSVNVQEIQFQGNDNKNKIL